MKMNEYNNFLYLVRKYRICYIGGAFVGKTALAIKLAQDLRKEGYRLWANIDVKGTDELDRIFALDPAERSCVILECAGLVLSDERYAQAFLEHVLSRHIIVLMPSSVPPHDLYAYLGVLCGPDTAKMVHTMPAETVATTGLGVSLAHTGSYLSGFQGKISVAKSGRGIWPV